MNLQIRPPIWAKAPGLGLALGWVFLSTLLAYAPALWNEYAYDSRALQEQARLYEGPEWKLVTHRQAFWDGTGYLSWRPLTALSLRWLDWGVFAGWPAVSHLLGILFHGLVAALVVVLIRELAGKGRAAGWMSVGAGLVLAVHPLASEVVYCGAFRSDSMAMASVLGAMILALRGKTGLSLLLLLLGCLAKETALAGVVAVPAVVVWRLGWRRAAGFAMATALVAALFLTAWAWFRFPRSSGTHLGGQGRLVGMANFAVTLGELALPRLAIGGWSGWPLRIDHDFAQIKELADPRLWQSLALLLGLAVAVALPVGFARRGGRVQLLAGIGAVILGLGLLPVSQILAIPDPVAERLWYPGLVGLVLLLAATALGLVWVLRCRHQLRRLLALVALMVMAGWWVSTHRRGYEWRDDLTLNIANWRSFPKPSLRAREALAHLLQDDARRLLAAGQESAARAAWTEALVHAQAVVQAQPEGPVADRLRRRILEPAAAAGAQVTIRSEPGPAPPVPPPRP